MTFTNGSKLFYSINNISFDDLCTLLRHCCSNRSDNNITTAPLPTVFFDVSWLARKLSSSSNNSTNDILSLASQFSSNQISVVLTHNNRTYRHHSKKASIVRDQEAEQAHIDVTFLKKKIIYIS